MFDSLKPLLYLTCKGSQKYLWIMARSPKNAKAVIDKVVQRLNKKGYDTMIETTVPHR